jgi:hypothetical protein
LHRPAATTRPPYACAVSSARWCQKCNHSVYCDKSGGNFS